MRAMIDINVVIDYVANREPFADSAEQVFRLCARKKINGLLSAGMVTTIYYVLRKQIGAERTLAALQTIAKYIEIVDVNNADITKAFGSDMPDFEDAVLAQSAKRAKATCIITRDVKDFDKSTVPVMSPEDFLKHNFNP